jgi:hypothetical protein
VAVADALVHRLVLWAVLFRPIDDTIGLRTRDASAGFLVLGNVIVVRFQGEAGSDFDALHRYMLAAHVRALADEDGFITLSLMLKPRSAFHERQELQGYINTWNGSPLSARRDLETFG